MKRADIFNILRITTAYVSTAELKANILPERALQRLKEYEDTGVTPQDIWEMKETILNLHERIKKLEGW